MGNYELGKKKIAINLLSYHNYQLLIEKLC